MSPEDGDQVKLVGPLAVNFAVPPEQIVWLAVATMAGGVVTVTLMVSETSLHHKVFPVMV